MRALLQRVTEASVTVAGEQVGAIGPGLLMLLGVGQQDVEDDVAALVDQVPGLRIFEDSDGKMNKSLRDVGGALLVVSQFTLFAETSKGRRPSFTGAMAPAEAKRLYLMACAQWRATGLTVAEGVFGAEMKVALVNDGPVTIWLDTHKSTVRQVGDGFR